jgi:hypothetical protein
MIKLARGEGAARRGPAQGGALRVATVHGPEYLIQIDAGPLDARLDDKGS